MLQMVDGGIISNEEWLQELRDRDSSQTTIDDFIRDKRGDHTVRVLVTTEEGLARYLFLSFRDSGDSFRKIDKKSSRELAEGAFDVLAYEIENSSTPSLPWSPRK